jgi:hypothetical protein
MCHQCFCQGTRLRLILPKTRQYEWSASLVERHWESTKGGKGEEFISGKPS